MFGARAFTHSHWRHLSPGATFVGLVLVGPLVVGVGGPSAAASTLARCPTLATWPIKPVSPVVRSTVATYYAKRHLTPTRIIGGRMRLLNPVLERSGVHWCLNAGGGRAGYVGVVPKTATAAVLVQVQHRPYPVVGSTVTWATVVHVPTGWKVVADDTAP